ncbi:MAG: glycosyltransferase family 1 protein [Chryseobacterium sp.]|nr:MAG: glycosyltransferase family 1 protein [Chryseobacterium sp.]
MTKVFRISTVPSSLNILLKGQLKYLNQYFDITAVSGGGEDLDEVRDREGVKTYVIEMKRQISPLQDLVSLVKLYFYFKKEKPDIVHSLTPKAGLLSMVAAKMAGVPFRLHTFTGLVFPHKKGTMQKILVLMDKILCFCATNIYPEGNGVKNDLEKYQITTKPLKVIANGNINGVDLDYFNPESFTETEKKNFRKDLNILPDDFVFLFVGRLVKDKGINELVTAFLKLSKKNPKIKLLLVGPYEDDLDPVLPETKKAIENHSDIISVGFQKDVRPYFTISDIFVFPSHREGFPNVLLQAGAMDLFSIVTDISGSNEIVQKGRNGTIIPVDNIEKLFLEMEKIMKKKQSNSSLEMYCRSIIKEKYNQSVVWQGVKSEYEILINNN